MFLETQFRGLHEYEHVSQVSFKLNLLFTRHVRTKKIMKWDKYGELIPISLYSLSKIID